MATINSVIESVRVLRNNPFDDSQLAKWVWELEQKVVTEVQDDDSPGVLPPESDWDGDLSIVDQYESLYEIYLISKIDFALQEYEAYNNDVITFNAKYDQYRAWYARSVTPPIVHYWKGLM